MIYGVSIGENKAVVVKFHVKDGKPILEVNPLSPLSDPSNGAPKRPTPKAIS